MSIKTIATLRIASYSDVSEEIYEQLLPGFFVFVSGIVLPTCTDLTTAMCKAISVVFAGAASLPVGLEV
jgi:hypothetical protein